MDRIPILRKFLVDELSADPADVQRADTLLVEEDIIDSLGIFSMIDYLETHFAIVIDPEDITIENFATLLAIDELVGRKLASRR